MAEGAGTSARELTGRARAALSRGEPVIALEVLRQAEAVAPRDPDVPLTRAMVHRTLGDLPAALRAVEAALVLDPLHFLALLSKGSLLEQQGLVRRAAVVYGNALALAPSDDRLPRALMAPVARARRCVAANSEALRRHLQERLSEVRRSHADEDLARFDECLDIFAGTARPYVQQPVDLYFPRLPAIPFYDRALFPWLAKLEAATREIRAELAAALATTDEFRPYIAFPAGRPINQWGELNHSRRWSSYFLWRDGVRQDAACARCPRTAALLSELPLAHQEGFAPTAMFSALEPHTAIPPHTGSINTRLIVHLPLILPSRCRFRVGNVTREWRLGEAWVFDDTIEHEARNDSDERRVILIFDVWNPLLSAAERELLTVMLQAKNQYFALDAPPQ